MIQDDVQKYTLLFSKLLEPFGINVSNQTDGNQIRFYFALYDTTRKPPQKFGCCNIYDYHDIRLCRIDFMERIHLIAASVLMELFRTIEQNLPG